MKLAYIVAAAALAACANVSQVVSSKPIPVSASDIDKIKAAATRDFFDPDSARFKDIIVADVTLADGTKVRRFCGHVNGKNQFGGYVGYEFFGGEVQNGQYIAQDFMGPCEKF